MKSQVQMFKFKENYNINDLVEIMAMLRGENGCPWDKEQDHHSIRMNVLEEAYEVAEAIDLDDNDLLREELGDLLLQVIFHARIEEENGSFDFDLVCNDICQKLIYRHPHVFGELDVRNAQQVLDNWEVLKQKSKGQESYSQTLESVPITLPSLMKAQKVGKRAAKSGADYSDISEVFDHLRNSLNLIEDGAKNEKIQHIDEKLGDFLFICCDLFRMLDKNAEKLLTDSINKFIMRFRDVEKSNMENGGTIMNTAVRKIETAL